MKIVLCNKYFFVNGGTERYLSTCLTELPKRGHEAIPFSVAYARNWPSPYSSYFLPSPGDPDQTHYRQIRLTPASFLRHIERSLYSFAANRALGNLLTAVDGADIGYVLNVYNYMSPSILRVFRSRGIPVVVRFGDYNALCASYTFLRQGKPCLLCGRGNFLHGIFHRCVKGSLFASALRVTSMYIHRFLRLYEEAEAVIAPCAFMRERLIAGGFSAKRIHVIPQPALPLASTEPVAKGDYILYFGRLSREKGLDTLLRAYQDLAPAEDLVLVGNSFDGCREELATLVLPENKHKVRFLGFLEGADLSRLVAGARLTVVPSRWYDNAPLAVLESALAGTPVLGAAIGGIPELIQAGITGMLFAPDDAPDLAATLGDMLSDRGRLARMGEAAKRFTEERFGLSRHFDTLMNLFTDLASGRKRHG
jgi:glycosyltransferase involved in cell wall biosynthesis